MTMRCGWCNEPVTPALRHCQKCHRPTEWRGDEGQGAQPTPTGETGAMAPLQVVEWLEATAQRVEREGAPEKMAAACRQAASWIERLATATAAREALTELLGDGGEWTVTYALDVRDFTASDGAGYERIAGELPCWACGTATDRRRTPREKPPMPDDPRTMDQDALTGAMADAGDWLEDANPDLAQACYWMADLLGTLDPSEFTAAKRRILAAEAEEAAQETGDAATGGPQ